MARRRESAQVHQHSSAGISFNEFDCFNIIDSPGLSRRAVPKRSGTKRKRAFTCKTSAAAETVRSQATE